MSKRKTEQSHPLCEKCMRPPDMDQRDVDQRDLFLNNGDLTYVALGFLPTHDAFAVARTSHTFLDSANYAHTFQCEYLNREEGVRRYYTSPSDSKRPPFTTVINMTNSQCCFLEIGDRLAYLMDQFEIPKKFAKLIIAKSSIGIGFPADTRGFRNRWHITYIS